jgi:hypothetical protein
LPHRSPVLSALFAAACCLGCHRSAAPRGAGGQAGEESPPETGGRSGAADASSPVRGDVGMEPADASPSAPEVGRDLAQPSASPDTSEAVDAGSAAAALVAGLSMERFRANIQALSALGDRTHGSPSFDAGAAWLEKQLTALGYTVEHHPYTYQGEPRINIFTTKIGSKFPDRMYLVMSHLDGRGGGGAADDNGSGVSLVLEVARALAQPGVETDTSVRFCFWDNEETGMQGSGAYVRARVMLQGMETPAGSHRFPEPRWLGAIQHDMMLYDHGFPPGPTQSPMADINVDYQASARAAADGKTLAQTFATVGVRFAKDYPVTVGSTMAGTDSVPFQDYTASISVREARRLEEIIRGSNPNHHQPTDVYATYSDADFRLGFNALELTMGTVAELAGAHRK